MSMLGSCDKVKFQIEGKSIYNKQSIYKYSIYIVL